MENEHQLRHLLQAELDQLISSRSSLESTVGETYERFLREKLAALSSPASQQIRVDGNVGPAAIIGEGSIQANIIAGGNVFLADSQERKIQLLEEDYLTTLIKMNSRLFLGPLNYHAKYVSPNPDIAQVYIPLDVIATLPLEGDEGDLLGKDRPLSVVEAISQQKHLVLLGDPGSGKSTVLKYFTWCLASMHLCNLLVRDGRAETFFPLEERLPGWQEQSLFPIPIALPDLAKWIMRIPSFQTTSPQEEPTLDAYLHYYLSTRLGLPDFSIHVHKIIRKEQAIFFLDGLDEITDIEARKKVLLLLKQFIRIHPDIRVVVTCRVLSYSNPSLQLGEDFTVHILAGLTLEQAQHFIGNWYNLLVERRELQAEVAFLRAGNLQRLISMGLTEFRSTPLLLTIMAIVHASTGDLPREKARLYDQCCEILLWQWQQAKSDISGEVQQGISDILGTRQVELQRALANLAYYNYARKSTIGQTSELSESDIMRIFPGYLGYESEEPDGPANAFKKAKQFLDYIQFQAGLLIPRGSASDMKEPAYTFIHRTFQEFLAGYYLTTQRDLNRQLFGLISSENGDQWYEVMRLAIGHMVFNSGRIEAVIDIARYLFSAKYRTLAQERRAIWWAAEMLAIAGKEQVEKDEVTGKNLLPELRSRLAELLTAEHFSPRYLEAAGNALARLGDPRKSVTQVPPACVKIPAKTVVVGLDRSVERVSHNEQPGSFVALAPFEIGVHPVTNSQFRAFMLDKGYDRPQEDCWLEQGWRWCVSQKWRCPEFIDDPDLGADNKPVVGVSWFEAIAYVNWLCKRFHRPYRLPTEAEWERTARGTQGWLYPWEGTWRKNAANTSELELGVTTPVGVFPAGNTAEGCTDMVGNVWEWCQSLYAIYPYRVDDGREELESEGPRILRGGAYQTNPGLCRCTYRMWRFPAYRNRFIGFRVVLATEGDQQ